MGRRLVGGWPSAGNCTLTPETNKTVHWWPWRPPQWLSQPGCARRLADRAGLVAGPWQPSLSLRSSGQDGWRRPWHASGSGPQRPFQGSARSARGEPEFGGLAVNVENRNGFWPWGSTSGSLGVAVLVGGAGCGSMASGHNGNQGLWTEGPPWRYPVQATDPGRCDFRH